ncbi:hypothetical protein ACRAWF_11385 [Streptomyces sp. L7]
MNRVEHVMGFPVSLRIDDEGGGSRMDQTADALFAWLREVDVRFQPVPGGQRGVPLRPGRSSDSRSSART